MILRIHVSKTHLSEINYNELDKASQKFIHSLVIVLVPQKCSSLKYIKGEFVGNYLTLFIDKEMPPLQSGDFVDINNMGLKLGCSGSPNESELSIQGEIIKCHHMYGANACEDEWCRLFTIRLTFISFGSSDEDKIVAGKYHDYWED